MNPDDATPSSDVDRGEPTPTPDPAAASGAPTWTQPPFSPDDPGFAQPTTAAPWMQPGWSRSGPLPSLQFRTPPARPRRSGSASVPAQLIVGFMVVLGLLGGAGMLASGSGEAYPFGGPIEQATSEVPDVQPDWSLSASDLRSDLDEPRIVRSFDGSVDGPSVVVADDMILTLTGGPKDADIALQGIDGLSGERRWMSALPEGLCATRLAGGEIACAAKDASAEDSSKPWRVVLIDPATGEESMSEAVPVAPQFVGVVGSKVVLVSQAGDAAHAVLSVLDFDAAQGPAYVEHDLASVPAAKGLFVPSKTPVRVRDLTNGPMLGNVRLRPLSGDKTALEAGHATIVLDDARGTVSGVLPCDQLLDDGSRFWCDAGGRAQAYGRDLKPRHRTPDGVRLAPTYPSADGKGAPVFLDSRGRVVAVDRATGKVGAVLANTSTATRGGVTQWPTASVGPDGVVVVGDVSGRVALSASGKVAWRSSVAGWGPATWVNDALVVTDEGTASILRARSGKLADSVFTAAAYPAVPMATANEVIVLGPEEIGAHPLP